MTKAYVTPNYPAVCSYELVTSFVKAAEDLKYRYRVGVGRSQDSEYLSTGHPSVGSYFQAEHLNIVDYYNRAGVMYCDRESAAIVTLCSLFGRRGGAVIRWTTTFSPTKALRQATDRTMRLISCSRALPTCIRSMKRRKRGAWSSGLRKICKTSARSHPASGISFKKLHLDCAQAFLHCAQKAHTCKASNMFPVGEATG